MVHGTAERSFTPTYHHATCPLPTDFMGRRLVVAHNSRHRLVKLPADYIPSDPTSVDDGGSWFAEGAELLVESSMSPNSVTVADLGDLDWRTVIRLAQLENFMEKICLQVGRLDIYGGFNADSPCGLTVRRENCSSAPGRLILLTSSYFTDLEARSYRQRTNNSTAYDPWPATLMNPEFAGLPEPITVHRGFNPLVRRGFECPFDEIVQVCDNPRLDPLKTPFMACYPTINK